MTPARTYLVVLCCLAVVGCDETALDGDNETGALAPVSSLTAWSAGVTAVGLRWTVSTDATNEFMTGYRISVVDPATEALVMSESIPREDSAAIIRQLDEGRVYAFRVQTTADSSRGTRTNSAPVTILWAAARRIDTLAGGGPIRVYETSGSGPSGLILYKAGLQGASVLSLLQPVPADDTLLVDLYLRTESATSLRLRSAHLYSARSLPRRTVFSSEQDSAAGLDDGRGVPPDTSSYVLSNTSVLVSTDPVNASRILYVRGDGSNYARILVRRQANGSLVGGTVPDRFIEVEISYQTAPLVQYVRQR